MRSATLRSLTLGAALALGASTLVAQPPAGAPGTQQPTAGQDAGRMDGARGRGPIHGRRAGGLGPRGAMGGEARIARAALRGITLSEAQRTQLRGIAERHRTERRAQMDRLRQEWQANRPAAGQPGRQPGERPDSATRAARQAARQQLAQQLRTSAERQVADVRAVLTPEQRTTFDRNVTELRQRFAERARQRGVGRGEGRGEGRGWRQREGRPANRPATQPGVTAPGPAGR